MRGRRIRWPSVRGFTLVELLVVLALLVSLAALCWPELRKPLAQSRLRDAGRQLRAELGKARQEAFGQREWLGRETGHSVSAL